MKIIVGYIVKKHKKMWNIFKKSSISIHKQYLGEDKKKIVKSNMLNLLNKWFLFIGNIKIL